MTEKSTTEMTDEEAKLIDTWIYVLLASNDFETISGRVRFTKEFFLMTIRHLPEVFDAAQFYPYHFGPYSTKLGVRMNELKNERIILAEYKNKDWQYSLSQVGQERAKEIISHVNEDLLKKIASIKRKNKNLSLKELLRDIYLYYEEYATRSIIASDIIYEKLDPKVLIIIDDTDLVTTDTTRKKLTLEGEDAQKVLELIKN